MSEHTPGPWFLEIARDMLWIGPKKAASDKVAKVVTGISHGDDYREEYNTRVLADARLIAAAPDLLAALKQAAEVMARPEIYTANPVSAVRLQIADALAKVEG